MVAQVAERSDTCLRALATDGTESCVPSCGCHGLVRWHVPRGPHWCAGRPLCRRRPLHVL
eukprot:4811935-Lingulodinium_polyedra.AAC.1